MLQSREAPLELQVRLEVLLDRDEVRAAFTVSSW